MSPPRLKILSATLEERFPTNVVLSLVSGAEVMQLGQSEFEHRGSSEIWALAMTLSTGQVDCKVSRNIRQQQYERLIGPIAFHPLSVIFETPNHAALLEKIGVKDLVGEVIDELVRLAEAQDCNLAADFKQRAMDEMTKGPATDSIMWQDYIARRPMEVETFLGAPVKLAKDLGIAVPRIETLYTILHNLNIVNRTRPQNGPVSPNPMASPPPSTLAERLPANDERRYAQWQWPTRSPRATELKHGPADEERSPVSMSGGPNGFRPSMNGAPNGYGPPSRATSRRGSMEGADLEDFSHLVLYDDIPEGGQPGFSRRRFVRFCSPAQMFDDDDDDDDYVDPMAGPPPPLIDPDNFDMMSVTSRKNRKNVPAARDIRKNPESEGAPPSRGSRFRPSFGRHRTSQMSNVPGLGDNILDDPLVSCSSNRYGTVDRGAMQAESRANSLTASRLDELQYGQGPMGGPMGMNGAFPRRTSQSPGNPYSPSVRGMNGRPSPPNGYASQGGRRPSPPNGVQQPVPMYPPGQGNSVAPHQVEQHAGVSSLYPPSKNTRSLTGSASASAGSGDSQQSLSSSQSSFNQRPPIGVR
ncbi:unnamed protein product [Parascedosporium putredinis]|uniref:Ketopantoate reductase C-terminal domain-containing protein n=1 Tax=Parascedosporium putredinis TaxID=1442378 RepID=A0A9P1GV42_9PEZI|nr:unnamed protein product [Parascedosporium putredinis]CAI7988207.1 unnamed protein product [Parascedosporium putredinis]